MINAKVTKNTPTTPSEEKLFKLLESIDWKLWEIMNMIKDNVPEKEKTPATKTSKIVKTPKKTEE
jgi:hypothetical protein